MSTAPDPPLDQPTDVAADRRRPLDVDTHFLSEIIALLADRDKHGLRRLLEGRHPADGADALEALEPGTFPRVLGLLADRFPPAVLVELEPSARQWAVSLLPDVAVQHALEVLDSDDAALVLNDAGEERGPRLLAGIAAPERAQLENSLSFDDETAGRLMQREFVAAPQFWTVGQTIDHMRAAGDDLPETFFEIYIVDPAFRLQGSVPLAHLLRTQRDVPLAAIQRTPEAVVRPDTDQEEVALLFRKYHLASAPVVDDAGRLKGMITVDDMVEVISQEGQEDLLALHGVSEAGAADDALDVVKARAPWLAVNLLTAFAAAGVISLFADALETIVALAILMPVVAALAGNAGSQALAVAVRGLAARELTQANAGRAIRREALAGAINGLVFATGVALISLLWFRDPWLAGVIWVAMFATFIWAGLAGILVPLGLQRAGADPAVASSVFVLTATDVAGFFLFLGLASLILM